MDISSFCSDTLAFERTARSVVAETALATQKPLVCLLMAKIGSLPNDIDVFPDAIGADKRFPFSDLKRVTKLGAEIKDAGEAEDDDDDD
ncbi:hypothetical protein F0562_024565 [Nyssa sinensis]|uniref:Uncharacterized protein n=1 Tax=Nyssa sinensis TaxID=561372 RepID=A0A5J5BDA6_9ASTE|nr:hypothetical protein F0562_024565 [Nyssa sinensis]